MKIDKNDILNIINFINSNNSISEIDRSDYFHAIKSVEPILIGSNKEDVRETLKVAMRSDIEKSAYYDSIVSRMTWDERIKFLQMSGEEIKKCAEQNIKNAALLVNAAQIGIKIIPLILMFV